jgi:hypothetical protein
MFKFKRKKNEFRPDRPNNDILGKLLLTKKQSKTLLRWVLFCLVCLAALLVQDVLMSRFDIFGVTTDLVPGVIFAICILQGGESGSIFALIASALYYFSGSAPGPYCIVLITALGIVSSIFRQAYLRKGFSALMLCAVLAVLLYELSLFGIGAFLGSTTSERLGRFVLTAALTAVPLPALYPVLLSIGKIGGETWKE